MFNIYLSDYNIPTNITEDTITMFLPYSLGLLQSYAQTFPIINDNYQFMPFIFGRDTIDNIIKKYDNPAIIGFSTSVWNYELSLAMSRKLKEKFPSCYIIFGGPHAPLQSESFFHKNPFVDIIVYGEGEKIFTDILLQKLKHKEPHHVTISCKESTKDLDMYPSPYVNGLYDDILKNYSNIKFKTIIETSRGCPFQCAYCFWGHSALIKKMGFHSQEYIKQDALWLAKNKIEYIFCADSNFGMFKQDVQTAQIYADVKKKYQHPKKFRVCYGKNAEETIFQTASILHDANLAKSVTLSVQSMCPETLKNINRTNINLQTLNNLRERYSKANIPTYTEIILSLPGDTYQSFIDGTEQILQTIKNNQLFIYICQVLPNSKLDSKEYREKFELKTIIIPLLESHYTIRPSNCITEYMEILIGTRTMSIDDFVKCVTLGWIIQMFHGFIGYNIIKWLVNRYNIKYMDIYQFIAQSNNKEILKLKALAENILNGVPWQQHIPKYGNIYYEPDEVGALNIICEPELFYVNLLKIIKEFLLINNLIYDSEIEKIIESQKLSLPNPNNYNNTIDMATDVVLFGRKSKYTTSK